MSALAAAISPQRPRSPRTDVLEYYRGPDGRSLLLRHLLGLAASAFALCIVFGDGRLDIAVARWFFDDASHAFPLREQWFLKTVLHDAARTVSAIAALALIGVTLASWVTRRPSLVQEHRRELAFAAAACVISAAVAGALKHFSPHACPWDLTLFGGTAVFRPLLHAVGTLPDVRGCLPAAHPLSGYAWLGVGFAFYPAAKHVARTSWGLALALGTLFGIVQILRGAHFVSHVLWSAWVVWAVNIAILSVCAFVRLPRRHLVLARRRESRPSSAEAERATNS